MVDPIDSASCDPMVQRLAQGTINLAYRKWDWGEGVAQYGLLRAAQLLDSERCLDEVRSFVHANENFQPDEPVHIMPALPSLLYWEMTGDERGLALATRVVNMLRTHPRSKHGAFVATPVRTAWVDYIYETVPFLYHYYRLTGSTETQQWAVEQTVAYLMSCWNARDGLFAHVYYDDIGAQSQFYWARANGWIALGLIEVAQLFPPSWGLHSTFQRIFSQLTERLVTLQRSSGLWNTVLHDARTYEEASATAMISLALRQGVRLGWLDPIRSENSDHAWAGVVSHVDESGQLQATSAETPPGDADFYQEIEAGVYPWGQGFALLAALERSTAERFDSNNFLSAVASV